MKPDSPTPPRVQLILEPISKRISIQAGISVYDAIKKLDLQLGAICGGKGTCGKCLIRINKTEANVNGPTPIELKMLSPQEIEQGFRLACQTLVYDNTRITLTDKFFFKTMQILTSGIETHVPLRPKYWKLLVNVSKISDFPNLISDLERVRFAIKREIPIINVYERQIETTYQCLKKIPFVLREQAGMVTATLETTVTANNEKILLLNLESGDTTNELFGLAIDLGTTTIVAYLIDLHKGNIVAVESMLNPQTVIGEDIITRITFTVQQANGMDIAQKYVHDALNQLIDKLTLNAKTSPEKIAEICIVGNTAMHHIFFGLPVNFLGLAPFPPVIGESLSVRNYHLRLDKLSFNSEIYSPPVIGGYVGADVISDMIAVRMDKIIPNTLLVDIGTNGEMVIGNHLRGLISASCAAGSAFEGAHLKNGMRAAEGAIEGVKIDVNSWIPTIDVIGALKPLGICGSGIVDITAELLRAKIITRSGTFNKSHPEFEKNPRIRKGANGFEYIIHSASLPADFNFELKDTSMKDNEIVITQDDIREIQKAKGAFLSGARLLMKIQQIKGDELEQIMIAGAFGNYIKKENAKFIGLIPDINSDNIRQIGNAAGVGAQMLLLNTDLRKIAEKMAQTTRYIEIANMPEFQKEYGASMIFPYLDLKEYPTLQKEYENIPLR